MVIKKIKHTTNKIKYGPHLKNIDEGEVKYLKGSHFDDDYDLSLFDGSYCDIDQSQEKYLLEEGDVLVAGKGYRNFAWMYRDESGPCVASSTFYVIKVEEEIVLPEYFVLLINSPRIQQKLRYLGLGPVTPSIPKNELLNVDINIPPLKEQAKAIKVYESIKAQIKIERQILEKKISLKRGLLNLLTDKT